ncbi:MAG: hypothetical protein IVW36_00055 [Dehalococcoidia bacterium]|nr:hypothetical protein [Dehalococcoidia bacterium]
MSEIFVDSLRNRIRALNALWQRAVADLTLGQVNHHERAGVLPLAFSLSHYIRSQDQSVSGPFLRAPMLWSSGGWAARVGVNVDQLGREETVAEMEQLRFQDVDAWRAYQSAVLARTDAVLDGLTAAVLAEVLLPQLPPNMLQTFCAMVIGPSAPLRKLEVLECFVYQHGLRHMGEVEHGRALVGLGGMTS